MMFTLLYAPPASGKTLAALAVFPDAHVITPKAESALGPAKMYDIDLTGRVHEAATVKDLRAVVKSVKSDGRPIIIDDFSIMMDGTLTAIKRKLGADAPIGEIYGTLKDSVQPWLMAFKNGAQTPVIFTSWEKDARKEKNVEGTNEIIKGGPALPGSTRDFLPGLCTHMLRIEAEPMATSAWPFVFRCSASSLAAAKCRDPASVPQTLPLALSAIYRAAGYECKPLFDQQAECRARAAKALRAGDRKDLSAMFAEMHTAGVNLHSVAYAVTEARVEIALEDHAQNLAEKLTNGYF